MTDIFRKPLCWLGWCQTFITKSDENGIWGECHICGKKAGYITREQMRQYIDIELEAELKARGQSND